MIRERIAPQPEVISAILVEGSQWCGGPAPAVRIRLLHPHDRCNRPVAAAVGCRLVRLERHRRDRAVAARRVLDPHLRARTAQVLANNCFGMNTCQLTAASGIVHRDLQL